MTINESEELRKKQESSFAHRLWILQTAYEKSLDGKQTKISDIATRHNTSMEKVIAAFKILEKQMLLTHDFYSTNGIPHGIEITGPAIYEIENAPISHYAELENDVKELKTKSNDLKLKELEIKKLKEETRQKKYEIWVNVTGSIEKASKWFGLIFGN